MIAEYQYSDQKSKQRSKKFQRVQTKIFGRGEFPVLNCTCELVWQIQVPVDGQGFSAVCSMVFGLKIDLYFQQKNYFFWLAKKALLFT